MSYPVTQTIPVALVAFALNPSLMDRHAGFASSNVATLEWRMTEELPTQCSSVFVGQEPALTVSSAGLSLRALAQIALPDSRPLEDWEKKAADDFFWSQFS